MLRERAINLERTGEHEFEVESIAGQRIVEVTVRPVPAPEPLPGSDTSVEMTDPLELDAKLDVSPAEE